MWIALFALVAAAAAPREPLRCPILAAADDLSLLEGRLWITAAPGASITPVEDGFRQPARKNDREIVPWPRWRQTLHWKRRGGAVRVVVDDPLLLAEAAAGRTPLPGTTGGVSGSYRVMASTNTLWAVEARLALPDTSAIDAAVFLDDGLAEDAACQEAALRMLATIRPGVVARDTGGHGEKIRIPGVGRLAIDVPKGFGARVAASDGRIDVEILEWVKRDVRSRALVRFRVTRDARPGKVLAVKARWKHGIVAIGVGVEVQVAARTGARRRLLRKIAKQAVIRAD